MNSLQRPRYWGVSKSQHSTWHSRYPRVTFGNKSSGTLQCSSPLKRHPTNSTRTLKDNHKESQKDNGNGWLKQKQSVNKQASFFIGLPWWLIRWRFHLQCGRCGFDPWVGKIPWRRKQLPSVPVFRPGEFQGLYSPWGCRVGDMTERLALIFIFKTLSTDLAAELAETKQMQCKSYKK